MIGRGIGRGLAVSPSAAVPRLMALVLLACHGRETDEVVAALRADNERLRGEIAAARAENLVLLEDVTVRWPDTVALRRVGGNGGRIKYRRECPKGQALKGFSGMTGSVVDALVPVCAPVVPVPGARGARTIELELPMVGGRGGRPSESLCAGNGLMKGIRGRAADIIDQIQPACDEGRDPPKLGGEGGRDYERTCPLGWLAVGVLGHEGEYLESVSLLCADTSALRGAPPPAGPSAREPHTSPGSGGTAPSPQAPAAPRVDGPAPAPPAPPESEGDEPGAVP